MECYFSAAVWPHCAWDEIESWEPSDAPSPTEPAVLSGNPSAEAVKVYTWPHATLEVEEAAATEKCEAQMSTSAIAGASTEAAALKGSSVRKERFVRLNQEACAGVEESNPALALPLKAPEGRPLARKPLRSRSGVAWTRSSRSDVCDNVATEEAMQHKSTTTRTSSTVSESLPPLARRLRRRVWLPPLVPQLTAAAGKQEKPGFHLDIDRLSWAALVAAGVAGGSAEPLQAAATTTFPTKASLRLSRFES
mmetsp:Transcript_61154/g.145658  ORF Transcript_61154/g.145658 Transcript_61154/m.145658 type:complete len:251 (+) Transcript_61154:97-849(+)